MATDSHVTDPPSTTALKLWRADEAAMRPVLVECPEGRDGYDADGVEIFSNSHYETEAKAWAHLDGNFDAWVKMTGRRVERVRGELGDAEGDAAKAAVKFARYRTIRALAVAVRGMVARHGLP